jgi:hypothetical protein
MTHNAGTRTLPIEMAFAEDHFRRKADLCPEEKSELLIHQFEQFALLFDAKRLA